MKVRNLLTVCLAGLALSATAQTHLEGEEYFKADQFSNAKTLLNRNLNNPGTDKGVSYYYMGRIALLEKKTAEAAKYFEQGVQANPEYAYNYVGLGQIDLIKNDVKGAQANFKLAEKYGKKDAGVHVAIARAYYDVNPTLYAKEIDKKMQKARKTDMESPEIYIFEGDCLADNKDWGSAGSKFEMAVDYDNNATGAYVKYANLFRQVNIDYAINMLKKLLANNPTSALGQRELANTYYVKGDYANAASEYGKYVKNPNHFKEDEDRYAFLLFYDGKYQQGYDYATQLLNSNPENFSARRYQFMNAAQIKGLEAELLPMAESLYKAHLQNTAANKFAPIDFILIADELNRAKRPEEAVAVLQEGIKEMPENATFCKQLATVYVDMNDLASASDAYAQYLAKNKENDYNDFVQQSLYSYFAGVQLEKADAEKANTYFENAINYANKASEAAPNQYKPKKILGDVARARATKETVASVAEPFYSEAIVLLEGSADPSRYKSDAKDIYNYLGNYWLDHNDKTKAKGFFQKYLTFDPDNTSYRKFVESL